MSESDLMLVLNEALQKVGEGSDTRFSRIRYAPSGSVSALLTEKANAVLLTGKYLPTTPIPLKISEIDPTYLPTTPLGVVGR